LRQGLEEKQGREENQGVEEKQGLEEQGPEVNGSGSECFRRTG
jgi:hypothetical protein